MITTRQFRSNVALVHHPWGTHCVMLFKVAGVGCLLTYNENKDSEPNPVSSS